MTVLTDIIVGSTTYHLNDLTNFKVIDDDGFGLPPVHRLRERGPLQHGESDLGYRLDPRTVTLAVVGIAANQPDHFSRRASLIAALAPSDTPIILRYTTDAGDVRQLDCFYQSGLTFPSRTRVKYHAKYGFLLNAPETTWYDPEAVSVDFNLGGGGDTLLVPTAIPMTVGASTIDATKAIDYPGNWDSFPTLIRVTGPITDPKITNNTTGDILDFTGYTIAAGDYYDIDCRYGYKTVKDSAGANKFSELTAASDLSTWRLQAGSINSIRVQGSSITAATNVQVAYFTRYLGI